MPVVSAHFRSLMSWPDRQQVRSSWSVSDCAGTGDAAAGRTLTQNALVERSGQLIRERKCADTTGTVLCSLGWPFPTLSYKYVFK